jgi:hypothetical protein
MENDFPTRNTPRVIQREHAQAAERRASARRKKMAGPTRTSGTRRSARNIGQNRNHTQRPQVPRPKPPTFQGTPGGGKAHECEAQENGGPDAYIRYTRVRPSSPSKQELHMASADHTPQPAHTPGHARRRKGARVRGARKWRARRVHQVREGPPFSQQRSNRAPFRRLLGDFGLGF